MNRSFAAHYLPVCEVGALVKVLPTGDEEIDTYIDQIGAVVRIELPTPMGKALGDFVIHYFVQMPDGIEVCINSTEFKVQEA